MPNFRPALLDEARETVARVDASTIDSIRAPGRHQRRQRTSSGKRPRRRRQQAAGRELEKSKSPYYFMLDLAELAKKAARG